MKQDMANNLKLQILTSVIILILIIHNLYLKFELVNLINKAEQSKKHTDVANSGDQPSHPSQVLIYNRIPKTGSTSFMNVAYELFKSNK